MRKFNLKGNVAERLKGVPREERKPEEPAAAAQAGAPEMSPAFTEAQGLFGYAWRTDVGRLRKNNQDAVILGNGLAGVADGMGGHKGGEIASAGLRDGLLRETKDKAPCMEALREAVNAVNLELWEQQESDAELSGMGTTLTVLWPAEEEMLIGHVGDSRAYLMRDGQMKQVTEDHSMVADMVRRGLLSEEQAATHPMRNYITRAVGTEPEIAADIISIPRKNGDRWLVCSDGLHGLVARERLQELLGMEDPEEAADQMIREALDQGGRDNISLVLAIDETAPEAGEVAE